MFFSGQMGRDVRTGALLTRYQDSTPEPTAMQSAFPWVADMEAPVGAQAIAIYERYRALLRKENAELGHLLRYHIYQRDKHFFSVFDRVRRGYEPAPPASTAVGMGRFEGSGRATLCIDAIALRQRAEKELGPRTVLGGAAKHAAAAHFSHVVAAGHFLFLAGQIPIDTSRPGSPLVRNYDDIPEQGRFLRVGRSHEDTRNGPIAAQTWFTYDLIRQHLEAAGSSLDCILNLIVYLQDIRDFPTFHRVHEHFFEAHAPSMTVIEVGEVGHKGTLIEIEPTAVLATHRSKRTIAEPRGWRAPAQLSPIVHADGLAFLSGIAGAGDSRGRSNIYAMQAAAAVAELERRLAAARSGLRHIVHLTVYLDDISQFASAERVLLKAFGKHRPALTVLEVPAPAPVRGTRLSLTAIGWLGDGAAAAVY